jgi:F-type H+-transporting ATPase subunit delta
MASVTNTYARALADVVLEKRLDAARVLQEAESLAGLVTGNRELREVWESPSIAAEQKRKLLDAIAAKEKISREVRNFVAILIDKRRIAAVEGIVRQLRHELNRRLGFTEAEITSARELTAAERKDLEDRVEKLTGKKVRARYSQDSGILGGAVVKIGSTIYDGSVKGSLERFREQMVES